MIHAIGLNSFDPLFFDVGLTVEACIKEYNYSPVPHGMIKIHQNNTKVIEPDHRLVKVGRPKKKARIIGSGVRVCQGCNNIGHCLSTCTNIQISHLRTDEKGRVCSEKET